MTLTQHIEAFVSEVGEALGQDYIPGFHCTGKTLPKGIKCAACDTGLDRKLTLEQASHNRSVRVCLVIDGGSISIRVSDLDRSQANHCPVWTYFPANSSPELIAGFMLSRFVEE